MKRNIILGIAAAALVTYTSLSPISAAPCADTQWKLPSKVLGGVVFGMTAAAAKAALEKMYGGKAQIAQSDTHVAAGFNDSPDENFNLIGLVIQDGLVTRISRSYSDAFQMKLGGSGDALIAVMRKIIEINGQKADIVGEREKDEYVGEWHENGGVTLTVVGTLGNGTGSLYARYVCVALEREIAEKRAAKTSFGF